jgi:FKBP-type peptidyl-prolyl cis-trans isomerase SlyD
VYVKKYAAAQLEILMKLLHSLLILAVASFFSPARQAAAQADNVIKNGSLVSLEFTLSDSNGKLIESNKGQQPLQYTQGAGTVLPALEKQLAGSKAGDTKQFVLKPEEAYGPVNPEAFREFPKSNIPPEALKVGAQLTATNNGQTFPVKIHEIKENTVIVDFNHPLAGMTLSFDVKVISVQEPANP